MKKLDKTLEDLEEELKELKKLSPEERIARLAQLEKIKHELKKTEHLKEESISEISEKEKKKKEDEEKQKERERLAKKARAEEEGGLEEELEREKQKQKSRVEQMQGQNIYQVLTSENVYQGISELRSRARDGQLSDEDMSRVDSYRRIAEVASDQYRQQKFASSAEKEKFMENALKAKYALEQIDKYTRR